MKLETKKSTKAQIAPRRIRRSQRE